MLLTGRTRRTPPVQWPPRGLNDGTAVVRAHDVILVTVAPGTLVKPRGDRLRLLLLEVGPAVSAYAALDGLLPGYPGRDVASLGDEVHGWLISSETHSGEDRIGPMLFRRCQRCSTAGAPHPVRHAWREDDHRIEQLTPPVLRSVGSSAEPGTLPRLP